MEFLKISNIFFLIWWIRNYFLILMSIFQNYTTSICKLNLLKWLFFRFICYKQPFNINLIPLYKKVQISIFLNFKPFSNLKFPRFKYLVFAQINNTKKQKKEKEQWNQSPSSFAFPSWSWLPLPPLRSNPSTKKATPPNPMPSVPL